MKDKNVIKKASFLLRILLMFCWHVGNSTRPEPSTMENPNGSGHQILNKYLYAMLGTNAKNNLAPYKEIIFNSADPELDRKNPDERDGGDWDRNHFQKDYCESKANWHTNQAISYYNSGDYRRAAYELAYGFHYVQDIACPVHMDWVVGDGVNSEYPLFTDSEVHKFYERPVYDKVFCNSYSGCEDFQAVKDAYNDETNGMGAKLTSFVGSMKGFAVLYDSSVQAYIKNRWKVWVGYYKVEDHTRAKKRLIQDLAFAAAIQKRYLYRPGLEVFTE